MGDIETLRQADLAGGDIAAALALSAACGWNQTAEDWGVFIGSGRVIGLFAREGKLVATAATLPYGNGFGWISMVIVADDWRQRGLARRLMSHCIDTLRSTGRAAMLDATPAGAEVYAPLGFVALGGLERWEGVGGTAPPAALPPVTEADSDRLIAADAAAFGAERRFLLGDFLGRASSAALACGDSHLVIRRGHRATQLGPLAASSAEAAGALLGAAIARTRGPVFLDLLERWSGLAPLLEACGFRRQRPFRRMALGRASLPGDPARLVLAAGPEFG